MKTNFSLLFYMKKPKNYVKGSAPIYLRITVQGKRSEITAGSSCEPSRWNSQTGRSNGNKEEVKSFNAYLDNLQAKVYQAHRQLIEADVFISAESIRNQFLGKKEKSLTLIDIFKDQKQKMEALLDSEFKKETLDRLEVFPKVVTRSRAKWPQLTHQISRPISIKDGHSAHFKGF
ncbi:hypothetical protein H9X96_14660 [Pedobacter sp. N36a]|uniref:Arm DNA-binding domain-containing protein n=1 Tax=Pedobacter sp. N36a TaxID=2767996 RepID=UPI00165746B6|nr:Arm DNA-binding domain-containing protein [Pedobacter sp. N36a]MBC8987013.1 hypothetical protein [Pedobacter sp. N36a]